MVEDPCRSVTIVMLDNKQALITIERYAEETAHFAVPRDDATKVVRDYIPALISPRNYAKQLAKEALSPTTEEDAAPAESRQLTPKRSQPPSRAAERSVLNERNELPYLDEQPKRKQAPHDDDEDDSL